MQDNLYNKICKCAIDGFPEEIVGCVVGDEFVILNNTSNSPRESYQLSAKDKVMIFELGDSLTALVHSHPSLNNAPSERDVAAQKVCGFPFWIIGTDGKACTSIREVASE